MPTVLWLSRRRAEAVRILWQVVASGQMLLQLREESRESCAHLCGGRDGLCTAVGSVARRAVMRRHAVLHTMLCEHLIRSARGLRSSCYTKCVRIENVQCAGGSYQQRTFRYLRNLYLLAVQRFNSHSARKSR